MAELVSQQVQDYLDALKGALKLSPGQSDGIVSEVRADLFDHVHRLVDQGRDEPAAVAEALAELGPPDELARRIGVEVPPWNGPVVRSLRVLLTIAFTLLLAWIAWHSRADTLGFSWMRVVGWGTMFLTIILITWPGVVWRKNWMFSAIPAGCIMVLAMLAISLGFSGQTVQQIGPDGQLIAATPSASGTLHVVLYVLLGLFVLLSVYLLLMMQQPRQRLAAIGLVLLLLAFVELPYAWEERQFALHLDEMKAYLATTYQEQGAYPTEQQLGDRLAVSSFHYRVAPDGSDYSLFWTRPLSHGYELGYSTKRDAVWIVD